MFVAHHFLEIQPNSWTSSLSKYTDKQFHTNAMWTYFLNWCDLQLRFGLQLLRSWHCHDPLEAKIKWHVPLTKSSLSHSFFLAYNWIPQNQSDPEKYLHHFMSLTKLFSFKLYKTDRSGGDWWEVLWAWLPTCFRVDRCQILNKLLFTTIEKSVLKVHCMANIIFFAHVWIVSVVDY